MSINRMALAAMGCGGGGVACDPCGFGTKCYYEKMKRKGGNSAKVATARRLLTIIYWMLKRIALIFYIKDDEDNNRTPLGNS